MRCGHSGCHDAALRRRVFLGACDRLPPTPLPRLTGWLLKLLPSNIQPSGHQFPRGSPDPSVAVTSGAPSSIRMSVGSAALGVKCPVPYLAHSRPSSGHCCRYAWLRARRPALVDTHFAPCARARVPLMWAVETYSLETRPSLSPHPGEMPALAGKG